MTERQRGEVLIVVRDEALRGALLELLSTEGWDALAVPSVDDARARLARVRPAVLMLDVGPSESETLRLLDELSDREEAPPTLVVSEGDAAASIALAYGVGHLEKPFGWFAFESALQDAREARRRPSQRHRLPPV
jgi:DNA-binding NtrC family response regulator